MRILAIDAATRSGWAFKPWGSGDEVAFGATDIEALCGKKPSRGEKLSRARAFYADLIERFKPELVLFEAPFSRGKGTRLLYGYAAAIEACAHEAGAVCLELEASSVRRRILGKGTLDDGKATAIAWAREQGFSLTDDQDDEADALLLLYAGAASAQKVAAKPARTPKAKTTTKAKKAA